MMNNEVNLLMKMQQMINKFDELDVIIKDIGEICNQNPNKQQNVDYQLSDYLHRLEEDTDDSEYYNIAKEIRNLRLIRKDLKCTSSLIKAYNDNKDMIFYCPGENRKNFTKAIEEARQFLHEDYKYRILTDEDLNNLKIKKDKRLRKLPSKEVLEECIKNKMRNKDIAKKFNVSPSAISHLKNNYGLDVRGYTKKGE